MKIEMNCLKVDQMNYLIKNLGFNDSTASMILVAQYAPNSEFVGYKEEIRNNVLKEKPEDIPSFTAVDMLGMLPRWQMNTCTGGYEIHVIPKNWDHALPYPREIGNTIIETVYRMLCTLKRKNLL